MNNLRLLTKKKKKRKRKGKLKIDKCKKNVEKVQMIA